MYFRVHKTASAPLVLEVYVGAVLLEAVSSHALDRLSPGQVSRPEVPQGQRLCHQLQQIFVSGDVDCVPSLRRDVKYVSVTSGGGYALRKISIYKGKFRATSLVAAVSGNEAIVTHYKFCVPSIKCARSILWRTKRLQMFTVDFLWRLTNINEPATCALVEKRLRSRSNDQGPALRRRCGTVTEADH